MAWLLVCGRGSATRNGSALMNSYVADSCVLFRREMVVSLLRQGDGPWVLIMLMSERPGLVREMG
jgi:hypothetical protein